MTVTNTKLRGGDRGVKDTIELMKQYAREYASNPQIQRLAASLASYCEECTLKNIFQYVVRTIQYRYDPPGVELVASPKHTILGNRKYGDCDDLSVALAALFMAAGHKCKYKTIAWRPNNPRQFSHVYVMVSFERGWIPMDAVMGMAGFGNEVKNVKRNKLWDI